jgi:small subunit ribosomal protein S3Ae
LLTLSQEKSGSSLKHLLLSSLNHLDTPAQTEPKVLVLFLINIEKVEDSIKGRVVSQMQADLAPNQDSFHWRKIKLIVDQTEGRQALTSFYGVDITRDELCSLIKKRKTLIEAIQDVKSQDGYVLRVFVIAFTRESPNQKRKTNYALSSQQKIIRKRINDIVAKEVAKSNATQILNLFTS